MSENRYVRLQDLEFDSIHIDCPVEIEKGALLFDTQTKSVLLQLRLNLLKLESDGDKIFNVTIKVDGLDDSGESIVGLPPLNFKYNDLHLLDEKSFGDKTPILLDPRIRSVKVAIEQVTTVYGDILSDWGEEVTPHKQKEINTLEPELLEQLDRDMNLFPSINRDQIIFIPEDLSDYWLCTCGRPNIKQKEKCSKCEIAKTWVFENINEANTQINLGNYNEEVRLLEEKKRVINIKRKKQLKLALQIIAGLSLAVILLITVIIPFSKYTEASNLLNRKEYDKAITIFIGLGEYRNSKEMINEASFQKANDLLSNKQYDEAKNIFTGLQGYKNSKELINEANYQKANNILSSKKYDEAIQIFKGIELFKNSKELINEANYQKANDLLSNKKFDEAIDLFASLKEYKNSHDLNLEAYYQKGYDLLAQNQFAVSADVFNKIIGKEEYKDSYELLNRANYLFGRQLFDGKKWGNALLILKKVDKNLYPDVVQAIEYAQSSLDLQNKEENYQSALVKASSKDYLAALKLLTDMNYKDSAELAKKYEKLAYAWSVDGEMTQNSYSIFDRFSVNILISGGKPGATVNIIAICTTPDWTNSYIFYNAKAYDSYNFSAWNESPSYASTGTGTMTIKNYSTGEVLARYEFRITY